MFSIVEHCSQAAKGLIDAQLTAFNAAGQAALDAGIAAFDRNLDSAKSAAAANTVLTRQWLTAGQALTESTHAALHRAGAACPPRILAPQKELGRPVQALA